MTPSFFTSNPFAGEVEKRRLMDASLCDAIEVLEPAMILPENLEIDAMVFSVGTQLCPFRS